MTRLGLLLALAACGRIDFDPASASGSTSTITLQLTAADDVTDVPVLVPLDPSHLAYADVGNPTTDLRFHDPVTDRDLPFEIDSWNPGGESCVWVRVPQLRTIAPVTIEMYVGAGADGAADPGAVWSEFDQVSHFQSSPVPNAAPVATGPASLDGASITPGGACGNAVAFAGMAETEQVTFAGDVLDGWDHFTLEFSLRADYASATDIPGEPRFLTKANALTTGRLFVLGGTDIHAQCDFHFTDFEGAYVSESIASNVWTYLVYTYDGQNVRMFIDGEEPISGNTLTMPMALEADPSELVAGGTLQYPAIHGAIDELRVSHVTHSPEWIRAQARSLARAMVTFGP